MAVIDWLTTLRGPLWSALKRASSLAVDWYRRRRAAQAALGGQDLAERSSLQHLIKRELEKLANADTRKLPPGLQPYAFRAWIQGGQNVELFEDAMILIAGNRSELLPPIEELLIADYQRITHDSKSPINNQVRIVGSYIHGQLSATEVGKVALQLALNQRNAANIYKLNASSQQQHSLHTDLDGARIVAADLLAAGKRSWKMPRFVAPLVIEARQQLDPQKSEPTSSEAVSSAIDTGENVTLHGAGGIGKTTFLLELGTSCLKNGKRIPIFVDAAAWGRTGVGLFDYIASRPSAKKCGVTSSTLVRLTDAGLLVVLINGWNEIPPSSKLTCREELIQTIVSSAKLNVVTTSRTPTDAPSLPDTRIVEIRGLTWRGQSAIIRAELPESQATSVLDILARDTYLRHAARSPIILRGLIVQGMKGSISQTGVLDLIGAAVQAFEEDDQRSQALSLPPISGLHRNYLEQIACKFTERLITSCSREETLQIIHLASTQLLEGRLIGSAPQPSEVLASLTTHHLLHMDGDGVRFAHQRFQEYFAAVRLLRECTGDSALRLLSTAMNQPAWGEALALAAAKLKAPEGTSHSRARLIACAGAIDLGIACDLAALCKFTSADDTQVHSMLVDKVNELVVSTHSEVRELGLTYQIASGFPAFADTIWSLLESENQQLRLTTHRLNGSAILISQLGPDTRQRMEKWAPERRSEFIHEIADSAENYDFLVNVAHTESDAIVRAAAISSLFWHFPASEAPIQAWLTAPVEVQTDRGVLSHIESLLEEGLGGEAVRRRLEYLVRNDSSDMAQVGLALTLPGEVSSRTLDAILQHLAKDGHNHDDARLLQIAANHAPERLLKTATEAALRSTSHASWIGEYLQSTAPITKHAAFEQAWAIVQGTDFRRLNEEVIGPLANPTQIERCVDFHLVHEHADRKTLTDLDRERDRCVESILGHVSGDDLLAIVERRGPAASYLEATTLLHLVSRRIGLDEGERRGGNSWLPKPSDVERLISLFAGKEDPTEVPQNSARVYLCRIASHVAPDDFGPFILDTCRRHLDAWGTYRGLWRDWTERRRPSRPISNPQWGLYLGSVLARWGPAALPGLLQLMNHSNAMDFVPEAIARVAAVPWSSKKDHYSSSVGSDIREGMDRQSLGRVLRQPEDSIQPWTDQAAECLSPKLLELVSSYESTIGLNEKVTREAEHRVGALTQMIARIPSPSITAPVYRAMTSGLMSLYSYVGALRSLVRQGHVVADPTVVSTFENVFERAAHPGWHDDSSRYVLAEACELLLCAVPTFLLSKSIKHYVEQWRRFAYPGEIARRLGGARSDAAWPALLEAAKLVNDKGRPSEEVIYSAVSLLSTERLPEFIALIADGTVTHWAGSGWTLERTAPTIATVLKESPHQIHSFLDACRQLQSTVADTLAGGVLAHIQEGEHKISEYLLEALDAGRATTINKAAFGLITNMFTANRPVGDSQYQINPRSSNALRKEIYARAKGVGPVSEASKRILASIEHERRENGRPVDEPRHPNFEDGQLWTDALRSQKAT